MRSAENKKKGPREVLAFPWDLSSYFLCGECRDRDEAERNRGALLIAAVLNLPCGECRDRDEAERNRGALLIAAVLNLPCGECRDRDEAERNRGAPLIAAVLNLPCGECRDRDEAERNRGALLIATVLTCLHKFLYLPRDDLHQPLPRFDRCPGDVRCDEKPVLIFYI